MEEREGKIQNWRANPDLWILGNPISGRPAQGEPKRDDDDDYDTIEAGSLHDIMRLLVFTFICLTFPSS